MKPINTAVKIPIEKFANFFSIPRYKILYKPEIIYSYKPKFCQEMHIAIVVDSFAHAVLLTEDMVAFFKKGQWAYDGYDIKRDDYGKRVLICWPHSIFAKHKMFFAKHYEKEIVADLRDACGKANFEQMAYKYSVSLKHLQSISRKYGIRTTTLRYIGKKKIKQFAKLTALGACENDIKQILNLSNKELEKLKADSS